MSGAASAAVKNGGILIGFTSFFIEKKGFTVVNYKGKLNSPRKKKVFCLGHFGVIIVGAKDAASISMEAKI